MFGFIYTIIGFAIFWGLVIFAVWFLWKNRNILKATKFKDWFSVRKWTSVLYSYAVSTLFPFHVIEQMVIRLYDEDCKGYIEEIDPSTGFQDTISNLQALCRAMFQSPTPSGP